LGDVATFVHSNSGAATIGMTVWDVRSALTDIYKSKLFRNSANDAWFQDGGLSHQLGDSEVLGDVNSAPQEALHLREAYRNPQEG